MNKFFNWTIGIGSVALLLSFALTASLFFSRCTTEELPVDPQAITVPAHTETSNDVIVADIGSGYLTCTQRGTITYRHSANDLIEIQSTPFKEAFGHTVFFYGKDKSIEYNPWKGTLTLNGGLPVEEDGTFQ